MISFVQNATPTDTGSSTSAMISLVGVTTGNLLIVPIWSFFTHFSGFLQQNVISITDNMGNTYFPIPSVKGQWNQNVGPTQVQSSEIWYAKNVIGGSLTLTVTLDQTLDNIELQLAEF